MKKFEIEYELADGTKGRFYYLSHAKTSKVANNAAIRYAERILANQNWKSIEATIIDN